MVTVGILGAVLIIQLTILNGLPLPGGGTADLILLGVICVGLIGGPRPGVAAGFWLGLALDLAPPAATVPGLYALVLCLAGYAAGRLGRRADVSVARVFSVVTVAAVVTVVAVGAEMAVAGLSLALGSLQAVPAALAPVLLSSVLYDIACIPLVVPIAVRVAAAVHVAGAAGPGTRPRSRIVPVKPVMPVGAVGWLAGPSASRHARRQARRQQDRLAVALSAGGAGGGRGGSRRTGGNVAGGYRAGGNGAGGKGAARPTRSIRQPTPRLGSPAKADRARQAVRPPVPRIAFSSGHASTLAGRRPAGVLAHGATPRLRFGNGLPGSGGTARRTPAAPRFAQRSGGCASGAWLAGARLAPAPSPTRRPRQPTFAGSAFAGPAFAGSTSAVTATGAVTVTGAVRVMAARPARAQKTARMRAGRGPSRLLPWTRRPGGRSEVWRIGSRRTGVLR